MKLVVDRIEGRWAVCFAYGDESVRLSIPLTFLPPGIQGGDHVNVTFEIDRGSTEREKEKAEGLLEELTRHSTPGPKKFNL